MKLHSLRRILRRDEGLGLPELLVTVFLGSLILGVVATTFATARGTVSGISARTTNTQQQRVALDSLTKNLRTAVDVPTVPSGFCYARPNEVMFYAQIVAPDLLPTLMRFSVDANRNLVEQRSPAGSAVAPCTTTTFGRTRILANNVLRTQPLFTYKKIDGTDLSAIGTGVADLTAIDAISIRLAVQTPTVPAVPQTTVTTFVRLPNLCPSSDLTC